MVNPEQQNESPYKVLAGSVIMQLVAVGMITAGIENINNTLPLPSVGFIGAGGLLTIISSKRWQDFHKMRDRKKL